MKSLNINVINVLVACTISLLVVLPDITLLSRGIVQSREDVSFQGEPGGAGLRPRWQNEPGQRPPPTGEAGALLPPPKRDVDAFDGSPRGIIKRMLAHFVFFFVLSLILLFVYTRGLRYDKRLWGKKSAFMVSAGASLVICILCIYFNQRLKIMPFDGITLFKVFFVALVSFLFVYVTRLVNQQQRVILENERLKSENLLARYNVLAAQVNPHFFFNSLNSLSSLVRERENEKSLRYINELSDIFRYVMKSNNKGLVGLSEELDFLRAYRYMMEIRYESKLFFDIRIDKKYLAFLIPVLSIQLLIENVIKHNEISEDKPLKINIYTTDDEVLVVSNPVHKKIVTGDYSDGSGLHNLDNRYRLLVSRNIVIENVNETFTVILPLTNNEK